MTQELIERDVLDWLMRWGEAQEVVRSMILFSSRSRSDTTLDSFSDYDVMLVVRDIHPYLEDEAWLQDFGPVLALYRDPLHINYGYEYFGRITQYEDGTKIDYAIMPVELIQQMVADPRLPDDFDDGYIVLFDKDGLTQGIKPPTYRAYLTKPPGAQEYRWMIDEFFSECCYVAKNLCRDELIMWKYNLDYAMKFELLRKMLEWLSAIDHLWGVKSGAYGKGLKRRLNRADLWAELESTYVGAGEEENWDALFRTIGLFSNAAREVGEHLGYAYPQQSEERILIYLHKLKN